MSDRLHEIIGIIGFLHNSLLENGKINDSNEVFEVLKTYDTDVQEHYLNLLLQYYFQKNDLKNLKELLIVGAKFDMRFEDVKEAFLNIVSEEENVIEFMEESIIFIKDNDILNNLRDMYEYYQKNFSLQKYLNNSVEIVKKNRYICAFCYKNQKHEFSEFFLNEDLLESLKRDLPYLLN